MGALLTMLVSKSKKTVMLAASVGIASAAGTIAIIAVLKQIISDLDNTGWWLIIVFAAAATTVVLAGATSAILLIRLAQNSIYSLRMELCDQILLTSLRRVERIGSGRLFAILTDDVAVIASAMQSLPLLFINGAIVIGALIYVGIVSPPALLILLSTMATGVLFYQLAIRRADMYLRRARQCQDEFHEYLEGITWGIKELKLNSRRREQLVALNLSEAGGRMARATIRGVSVYAIAGSWGQLLFLTIVGAMLLVGPSFGVSSADLVGFTLAVLYINTPLVTVMNTFPVLSRAAVALRTIRKLDLGDEPLSEQPMQSYVEPPRVSLRGVEFTYDSVDGEDPFCVGPVDVTFEPGTVTFIVGGNGSGKTTLAKLLCGLYRPTRGQVQVDGSPVSDDDIHDLRAQITATFSDMYLFAELDHYGEERVDAVAQRDAIANEVLAKLAMSDKVAVKNGRFTTLALSTGQRKRLALAATVSSRRGLVIFDEWAADQDPEFRQYFYLELLPSMRAAGLTVVVITHDDRYFGVADQLLKLDRGAVVRSGASQLTSHEDEQAKQTIRRGDRP